MSTGGENLNVKQPISREHLFHERDVQRLYHEELERREQELEEIKRAYFHTLGLYVKQDKGLNVSLSDLYEEAQYLDFTEFASFLNRLN
jgi:hypothetical protein